MNVLPRELILTIVSYVYSKKSQLYLSDLLSIKNMEYYTLFISEYPHLFPIKFVDNSTIYEYDWRTLYFAVIEMKEFEWVDLLKPIDFYSDECISGAREHPRNKDKRLLTNEENRKYGREISYCIDKVIIQFCYSTDSKQLLDIQNIGTRNIDDRIWRLIDEFNIHNYKSGKYLNMSLETIIRRYVNDFNKDIITEYIKLKGISNDEVLDSIFGSCFDIFNTHSYLGLSKKLDIEFNQLISTIRSSSNKVIIELFNYSDNHDISTSDLESIGETILKKSKQEMLETIGEYLEREYNGMK